jgi:hypothetical protein
MINMDWDKEPTLKEFATAFNQYVDETGVLCGDNPEGWIGSHKITGHIQVIDVSDDDVEYDIVGLDLNQLIGCGCPSDIVIKIKKLR